MKVMDPVCHMEVETEGAEWKAEHGGETYYFCAPGCMRSFEKEPDKYLGRRLQTRRPYGPYGP